MTLILFLILFTGDAELIEAFLSKYPHIRAELEAIRAHIPFDYTPKGVTCPNCTTWIMVRPNTVLRYYSIVRGEYVGIFFVQS